jgi:hypothetical protein
MNIATNPWSFTSADVPASSTAAASPSGMIQQGAAVGEKALAAVLLTTTGAHGLSVGQFITYIGDTNGRFNGWYKVIAVPSGTTALLASLSQPNNGGPISVVTAASGGGTILVNQVQQTVRAEDISVLATTAAPGATNLSILDRNGNVVWTFIGVATPEGFAAQNRGKVMWVDGLTLQSIPVNCTVLVTVN